MAKAARKFTKPQRAALQRQAQEELAVKHLEGFVRFMWDVVEPEKTLTWNWHLSVLCRELEGLHRGTSACLACGGWDMSRQAAIAAVNPDPDCEDCDGTGIVKVKELVVNVPPGHLKSRLSCVMFPAWIWLKRPGFKTMTLTHAANLASRDSRYTRNVVTSEKYQALQCLRAVNSNAAFETTEGLRKPNEDGKPSQEPWEPWGLDKAQRIKTNFANSRGGERFAAGILSGITGQRCEGMILDDPHDAKKVVMGNAAQAVERMREARSVFHGALRSRLNKGGWRLHVAQRLHVADLPGERTASGARTVCFPVRYDPDHPHAHPNDPREVDEWLCEASYAEEEDEDMRRSMTPRHHDAQYGQRPSTDSGGMFKRAWFAQYFHGHPRLFARKARFDVLAISVDCSFKDGPKNDFVVMQVWGWRKQRQKQVGVAPGRYLLDQVRGRMDLVDTCAALKVLRGKWQAVNLVLIEEAANGAGVIAVLKRDGDSKVIGYNPGKDGSKEARASVAAVSWEAGDCWVPEPEHAPWLADFIEEHVTFPAGANDDQVDADSQIQIRWDGEEATQKSTVSGLGWLEKLM